MNDSGVTDDQAKASRTGADTEPPEILSVLDDQALSRSLDEQGRSRRHWFSEDSESVAHASADCLPARADWDVIVIGAGPAGSMVARLLAQRGRSVLMVDAKAFPRDKVCGGCLSARAVACLARAGLDHLLISAGAVPMDTFEICLSKSSTRLPIRGGFSLSRRSFDQHLLEAAIAAGVSFLAQTAATVERESVGGRRVVTARRNGDAISFEAACVVCADGLLRSAARQLPELAAQTSTGSYLGVGTCIAEPSPEVMDRIRPGTISMAVGRDGYAGLARHERGGLSIAAAIAPVALKSAKSPEVVVQRLLTSVGLPCVENPGSIDWLGTPSLTSRARNVATERVFVIGDAAGYVEPFTGEGMATALESAWLAAPLVDQAIQNWNPLLALSWQACYRRAIQRRQWPARVLRAVLRYPQWTGTLLNLSRLVPAVPRWLISQINDPRPSNVSTESSS